MYKLNLNLCSTNHDLKLCPIRYYSFRADMLNNSDKIRSLNLQTHILYLSILLILLSARNNNTQSHNSFILSYSYSYYLHYYKTKIQSILKQTNMIYAQYDYLLSKYNEINTYLMLTIYEVKLNING